MSDPRSVRSRKLTGLFLVLAAIGTMGLASAADGSSRPVGPPPPANVAAVPASQSAYVSWDPVPKNSSVTNFAAVPAPGGTACFAKVSDRPSCMITGLANGRTYKVKVFAITQTASSRPSQAVSVRPSPISCLKIVQGANLQGCDFSHRNLTGVKLKKKTNMRLTNLVGATLGSTPRFHASTHGSARLAAQVVATGADLSQADLTGVASGGIIGMPAALPSMWTLVNGFLFGPGASLTGANLSGVNLSGLDLSRANFSGADLSNSNLSNSNLSGANLTGTNLAGSNLNSADLSGAILQANIDGADLTGVTIVGMDSYGNVGRPTALPPGSALINGYLIGNRASLAGENESGIDISGGNLDGVDFSGIEDLRYIRSGGNFGTPINLAQGCELRYGYLFGPYGSVYNADLEGADLSGLDLQHFRFAGTNLRNAKLTSDLAWASFSDTDLAGADLHGSLYGNGFLRTNLQGTNLGSGFIPQDRTGGISGSGNTGTPASLPYMVHFNDDGTHSLQQINLINGYFIGPFAALDGADLANADLTSSFLYGAYLHGADLSGADLSGTDLSNAILAGANLTGANLSGANLTQADAWIYGASIAGPQVAPADFSNAILSGANLTQTNLTSSNLTHANLGGSLIASTILNGADLTGATVGTNLRGAVYSNLTCPDGTNSDLNNGTCVGRGTA